MKHKTHYRLYSLILFSVFLSSTAFAGRFLGPYRARTDAGILDIPYQVCSEPVTLMHRGASRWTQAMHTSAGVPRMVMWHRGGACKAFDTKMDIFGGRDTNTDILGWTANYHYVLGVYWPVTPTGVRVTHSVIRFNHEPGSFIDYPADMQLKNILHEFGHTIGFGHVGCYDGEKDASKCGFSVMDNEYPNGVYPQEPTPYDIETFGLIYGD
jgi:hypothetical protein